MFLFIVLLLVLPSYRTNLDHPSWVINLPSEADYLVPRRNRELSILYHGAQERMRVAVDKMIKGETPCIHQPSHLSYLTCIIFFIGQPVKLGFVGGSCTEGAGLLQSPFDKGIWQSYPHRLAALAQKIFSNPLITMYNGASGGSRSDYMSLCIHQHLPVPVDIVYVEYAINDPPRQEALKFGETRASMEILVRRLLRLPSKPAVVMLNGFRWTSAKDRRVTPGLYYNNAESDFLELSTYYHLPTISIKAGAYHLMRNHVAGFRIDNMIEDFPGGWNHSTTEAQRQWLAMKYNTSFYISDGVHPAGSSGHRVYSEVAFHQIVRVAFGLSRRPLSDLDRQFIDGGYRLPNSSERSNLSFLPPPIIRGNYEPSVPSCYFGASLRIEIPSVASGGFEWVDDSKEGWRTKLGWKTSSANASMSFTLDLHSLLDPREINVSQPIAVIRVMLVHLKSYDQMGKAEVRCESGCSCQPTAFDGQWNERISITTVGRMDVNVNTTDPDKKKCLISITVLNETSSGGHKFKIAGLVMTKNLIYHGDFNGPAIEYLAGDSFDRLEGERSSVHTKPKEGDRFQLRANLSKR